MIKFATIILVAASPAIVIWFGYAWAWLVDHAMTFIDRME